MDSLIFLRKIEGSWYEAEYPGVQDIWRVNINAIHKMIESREEAAPQSKPADTANCLYPPDRMEIVRLAAESPRVYGCK